MDKILIHDLEIFAHHGVFPEEKKLGQLFLISLELFLDLREAGAADDLSKTISYAQVCDEVTSLLQSERFDLIERCAQAAASHILRTYSQLHGVKVTVKKPWAPIGKRVAYAAVEIERRWHCVYLGIGSNMGDPRHNLNQAVSLLDSEPVQVMKVSSYHLTKPVSDIPQEDYLNGAVEIRTTLSPEELMDRLLTIECKLGRERTVRWGPRTIDLDVLLYDQDVLACESIIVPHPRMHERLFVLEPLCEIAPYAVHPLLQKRMLELKDALQ